MQKAYKHNIKPNAKKNLQISVLEKKNPHSKISTGDGVLWLTLFVSINGDYTVTFTLAALVSPFLIIMQDLVGFVADALLLRGQLAEKWIR